MIASFHCNSFYADLFSKWALHNINLSISTWVSQCFPQMIICIFVYVGHMAINIILTTGMRCPYITNFLLISLQVHYSTILTQIHNIHPLPEKTYNWQAQVEIKHYSVAYFDCITAFSIMGEAHMHSVHSEILNMFTQCIWAPPLTATASWMW